MDYSLTARASLLLVALLLAFLGAAAFLPSVPQAVALSSSASTPPAPSTPTPGTDSPVRAPSFPSSLPSSFDPSPAWPESPPVPTYGPPPDQVDLPILMYHYVGDLPPLADGFRQDLTVSPEAFEEQLQFLAGAGYHPITLHDLYFHLTQGRPIPDRPILLTFDDGYRDAYTVVFPLLTEYGFVGTFFVLSTPAHYESPAYLTWAMMREMADAGMEIQGHGRDHVDLRGQSYDFLVYQIAGIKEALEYHTGQPVHFFCYPSGRYDEGVIDVVESAGYWGAVTTHHGWTHTREDLFTLGRVRIRGSDTLETFVAKVEGRY